MKILSSTLTIVLLLFAPLLRAQTAVEASSDPIQLSVFEVSSSKDVGYRAATTNAGTRTGEELKNLPQTITILTNDFIRDIGATDSLSAMDYAVGGGYKPSNSFDVNRFVFRGIINNFQSRNFNVWYIPSDAFSIDRIDIVRGPNSILFGEGDPGGMMNINTKRALFHDETVIAMRVGSWDQFRTTLDVNKVLRPNFAARINLVYDDKDNWQDWVGQKRKGIHFTTTWRSASGASQVRYEGEYGLYLRRVSEQIPQDQFSLWNGTTPFTFNAATGPTGTQRLSSATGTNAWIWDNSVGALVNWRGFGQSGGLTDQSSPVKNTAVFARGANFFGPSLMHNFEYNSQALVTEQKIGRNLTLQLEGDLTIDSNYRQATTENTIRRDPNATLPTGATNPHFGDYYLEYQWSIQRAHHYMPSGRFSTVYDWQPVSWMRQRFFGNAGIRLERFNTSTQREVIVNNPAVPNLNSAGAQVRRRVYIKGGDGIPNIGTINPFRDTVTGFQTDYATTQGLNLTDLYVSNVQLNASGEYFGGKFRTLLGGRRDYFRAYSTASPRNAATGLLDRTGQSMRLATKSYNTSHSIGGIWQVTPWISVYAMNAKSFRARSGDVIRIDGTPIGLQLGEGNEAGIRLDLFEGKFYVQANAFDIDQTQRATNQQTLVNTVNQIWNSTAANAIRPGYLNNAITLGTWDTDAANSKGYEIETWLNLLPGWTLQGGYSYSDPKSTEVMPIITAYLNKNLLGWQQLAASDPATGASLNPNIASVQNFLATQVPGARTVGANKHSFSLFTKYSVQAGPLKGLEIGAGMNYRSGSVLNNLVSGGAITPVYGDTSIVVNALLSYSRRLTQKVRWSVSLNVQNLLDKDYYLELNGITQSNFGDPRSWALTNSFRF